MLGFSGNHSIDGTWLDPRSEDQEGIDGITSNWMGSRGWRWRRTTISQNSNFGTKDGGGVPLRSMAAGMIPRAKHTRTTTPRGDDGVLATPGREGRDADATNLVETDFWGNRHGIPYVATTAMTKNFLMFPRSTRLTDSILNQVSNCSFRCRKIFGQYPLVSFPDVAEPRDW